MGSLKARVSGAWVPVLGSGFDAANTARWNSAWGTVAEAKATATSWTNATATLTEITTTTGPNFVSVYLYAGRRYRVYYQVQTTSTVAGDQIVMQPAVDGSTSTPIFENNATRIDVAGQFKFTWFETSWVPTTSKVYDIRMWGRRSAASTGTVSIGNLSSSPAWLLIEDLGPASPASISPPAAGPRVVASGNALGIVAFGTLDTSVGAMSPNTAYKTTASLYCFMAAGRRYRISYVIRALSAPSDAYVLATILRDGAGQYPTMGDRYQLVYTPGYQQGSFQWYFDGDDLTHYWDVNLQPGGVAVTAYPSPGGLFYIEDVGPNTYPALPLPATYPAWTAVTAFQNSWSNFDAPNRPAQYRKMGDEVSLRGVVGGGAVGYGTAIFTLPVGFRPPGTRNEDWPVKASGGTASITVFPNGVVSVLDTSPSNATSYTYFNGVQFSTTA